MLMAAQIILMIVIIAAAILILWLFWKLIYYLFLKITGRTFGGKIYNKLILYIMYSILLIAGAGLAYGGYHLFTQGMYYGFNSGPVAAEKARERAQQAHDAEYERAKFERERERLRKEERERLMKERVSELTSLPPRTQIAEPPYIKGKLVVFSQSDQTAGWELLTPSYLKDAAASSPDEVATVILLKNRKVQAGSYGVSPFVTADRRIPGYTLVSDLTIIDRTIPAIIYKRTFKGKPPGQEVSIKPGTKEVLGSKPDAEIQTFLSGLERR